MTDDYSDAEVLQTLERKIVIYLQCGHPEPWDLWSFAGRVRLREI